MPAEIIEGVFAPETLLGFVQRHGPVTTWEVASRFGWSMRDSLTRLQYLETAGKITKRLCSSEFGGRMYDWEAIHG